MKTSLLILTLAVLLPLHIPSLAGEKSLTGMQVYEKGKAALDRGDLVTARQCFEQLLKAKPDFEMAKIQLAQVVVAERELAKIPKVMKVARVELLPRLTMNGMTLEEAATAVARSLEKAAGGAAGVVNVTCGTLPENVRGRTVSLSASQVKFDHVLDAIGYSTGVQISYTPQGLAVREETGSRVQYDAGDPGEPDLSGAAGKIVIDRLALSEAELSDALAHLERKAADLSGGKVKPIFVVRHDAAPRSTVTLDLRNISLRDAVGAVSLMVDREVKWFPWGAGIGNRQAAAAVTGPAEKDAPAPKPSRP
jgi:hypothetical protein